MLQLPAEILCLIIKKTSASCKKNLSRTCKYINYLINNEPYIHKNNMYKTKELNFGSNNTSWKKNAQRIYFKNIYNTEYINFNLTFNMNALTHLIFKNTYISTLDLSNCPGLVFLKITDCIVKKIENLEHSLIKKLYIVLSTVIDSIKLNKEIQNINLDYTIFSQLEIPTVNSIAKFSAKNCTFNVNLPINNITALKKIGVDSIEHSVFQLIFQTSKTLNSFDAQVINPGSLVGFASRKLKKLRLVNSSVDISKLNIFSLEKLYLIENRYDNFNFLDQYKHSLVKLEISGRIGFPTKFIAAFKNLKSLYLNGNIDIDISDINSNLKTLYLNCSHIGNLHLLSKFKSSLKKLYISTFEFDSYPPKETGISPFESIGACVLLKKVALRFKGLYVNDFVNFLDPLVNLSNLTILDVNGLFVDENQLNFIHRMKSLKFINLPKNCIYTTQYSKYIYSFALNWSRFSKYTKLFYRKLISNVVVIIY
jgi:hypothetical protein